jgi:hypothetical protein
VGELARHAKLDKPVEEAPLGAMSTRCARLDLRKVAAPNKQREPPAFRDQGLAGDLEKRRGPTRRSGKPKRFFALGLAASG